MRREPRPGAAQWRELLDQLRDMQRRSLRALHPSRCLQVRQPWPCTAAVLSVGFSLFIVAAKYFTSDSSSHNLLMRFFSYLLPFPVDEDGGSNDVFPLFCCRLSLSVTSFSFPGLLSVRFL